MGCAGFTCRLARAARLAFLWAHRVSGRPLLPGAAMFEAAHAAGLSLAGGMLAVTAHHAMLVRLPGYLCCCEESPTSRMPWL